MNEFRGARDERSTNPLGLMTFGSPSRQLKLYYAPKTTSPGSKNQPPMPLQNALLGRIHAGGALGLLVPCISRYSKTLSEPGKLRSEVIMRWTSGHKDVRWLATVAFLHLPTGKRASEHTL